MAALVVQESMLLTIHQEVIFAARGKNLELLKQRLSAGGNINYLDDKYGSALSEAINGGDDEIIQYLIDNGANVNLENSNGIVPLELALHHASGDIVRKLSWSGAKIKGRCRPHWKERLESCLKGY